MHNRKIIESGVPLDKAARVLILLHGRGGNAHDILSLAAHLKVEEFALLAPQAEGNTWYPYSFLAPPAQNEPWLSGSLRLVNDLVDDLYTKGFSSRQLYFAGFSQGACLTLEAVTRRANQYGGVAAFTGGLIGDELDPRQYAGNFDGTPVFIGTSNPDPHVPLSRVKDSAQILEKLGAAVTLKVFPGMGHTISQEGIDLANNLVFAPVHAS